MWDDMKCKLLEILMPYKDIIVGGDGRNDSPGFSARFCLYVAMDLLTNLIIDMEVLDKRETGGDATNMEREGLTRILLRWMKQIDIGEIATDASSSLMRRISDLKAIHPQLKNMAHSLDVWHMSKRLTKKLHSLVDNKEGKELKPWIEALELSSLPQSASDMVGSVLKTDCKNVCCVSEIVLSTLASILLKEVTEKRTPEKSEQTTELHRLSNSKV
eukprot:gene7305-13004_t